MLPRPDIVFQLDADEEKMTNREDYGNEIYEKHEFQKKLREEYKFFHTYKYWKVINATREIKEVNNDIINEIEKLTYIYNDSTNENEDKNNYPNKVNEDLFSVKGLI
jgi:thymidylate kinase